MSGSGPIEHPTWLTSGDFTEADEPLRLFTAWFEEASRCEPRDPTAMSLATVDADGLPNVRMVLMKGFDERGFVFFTNVDSQKGRELDRDGKGALLFHWKSLNRQVRVRGPVGRLRAELQHHPYDDIAHHMRKIDAYTTLWAREAHDAGRRTGVLEMLGAAGWALLRNYVLKGGFRLGEAGLTVSLLNAHYTHAKLAKLRELMRADGRGR